MKINLFKNIKNNYGKYIARCVGTAAVGLVGYDAHIMGRIQADMYSKQRDADATARAYGNTMFMDEPSVIKSTMKDKIFKLETDTNIRTFINSAVGYVKGFTSMLVSGVVPFGLGIGAMFAKNKTFAKTCGWTLAAYGVMSVFKDGLGLGHHNDLNKKF